MPDYKEIQDFSIQSQNCQFLIPPYPEVFTSGQTEPDPGCTLSVINSQLSVLSMKSCCSANAYQHLWKRAHVCIKLSSELNHGFSPPILS